MRKSILPYFTLLAIVLGSTLLLWLPFMLRISNWFGLDFQGVNFLRVYQQYDGPLYIVAAKSLYNPDSIRSLHLELSLQPIYFAAHLPLYPFFIKLGASVVGYLKSMIGVNVFFTLILASFFYYLIKTFELSKAPLRLAIILLFLPRFLIVRSVGAPESLFMLLILLSLYSFERKDYLFSSVFGFFATMTKSPGVLLFFAYLLVCAESYVKTRKFEVRWVYIVLIPIGLLSVFALYAFQYHDFYAYFHTGGVVPMVFPYSVFNFQKNWVGTAWLEDVIFYFALYAFTLVSLWKSKYRSFFYFCLVFFIALTFVQHRDIARYSLPLWPLACIALEHVLTSKKFMVVFIILLPALILFSWNFLLYNVMPISNWLPYM